MALLDRLTEDFGCNEPILLDEIDCGGYSRPWLFKELNELCRIGKLVRFDRGIYYIPTETAFGASLLDPRKVIEKKYVKDSSGCYGYYSGATFLNQLGLSTQMPNTIEVCTNNEKTRSRELAIGKQRVILRRARSKITAKNAAVLSFLELMNEVPASYFSEGRKKLTIEFITKKGITRSDITEYAPAFPDKAMRTLVESEIIYHVAQ